MSNSEDSTKPWVRYADIKEKETAEKGYDLLVTYSKIREVSEKFFKQGHYRNAVLDSYIALEELVKEKTNYPKRNGKELSGVSLMRHVFNVNNPILKWSQLKTQVEKDELIGFQNIMAGAMQGIRNPPGHSLAQNTPMRALKSIILCAWLAEIVDASELVQSKVDEKEPEFRGVNVALAKDKLKQAMIKSFLSEIELNIDLLRKGSEPRTKYQHIAFWNPLRTNSFERSMSLDAYFFLSSHVQNKIATFYEKVKRMNELVKKLDGEQEALKIQKINRAQVPLINELLTIAPELISLLESGKAV